MDESLGHGAFAVVPFQQYFEDAQDVSVYNIFEVLSSRSFKALKEDISKVPLERVSSDLSQFQQSSDLGLVDPRSLPRGVGRFLTFLKTNVRSAVENALKVDTSEKITVTVSKYTKGDYLLCHDDHSSTRMVAFVFYLNTLSEEEGGALRFFAHDQDQLPVPKSCEKKLQPHENSLIFFRVNNKSHHEVDQVYTDSDRLSINGWFHFSVDDDVQVVQHIQTTNQLFKSPAVKLIMPVMQIMHPLMIMSEVFLAEDTLDQMAANLQASDEKAIVFPEVLREEFFKICCIELQNSKGLNWELQGPANYRCYETLPYEVEGPHISYGESLYHVNNLVDFLLSPRFMQKLAKITGVEFALFDKNQVPPACMLEIQRWTEGSYSLLCDNNIEKQLSSVELTIYLKVNESLLGSIASETDMSGVSVISVKPPMWSKQDYKRLFRAKMRRILNEYSKEIKSANATKKEKLVKSVRSIVQEKMRKLKSYRSKTPELTTFIVPADNIMVLSFGSKKIDKYSSYIKKSGFRQVGQLCYYAINIVYFTVDK